MIEKRGIDLAENLQCLTKHWLMSAGKVAIILPAFVNAMNY